jgi:hypothetical protein
MRRNFDPDDFAVVVKLRNPPPNPWRWEIHCAGKRAPIEHSHVTFATRGAAHAEGKLALQQLLSRLGTASGLTISVAHRTRNRSTI